MRLLDAYLNSAFRRALLESNQKGDFIVNWYGIRGGSKDHDEDLIRLLKVAKDVEVNIDNDTWLDLGFDIDIRGYLVPKEEYAKFCQGILYVPNVVKQFQLHVPGVGISYDSVEVLFSPRISHKLCAVQRALDHHVVRKFRNFDLEIGEVYDVNDPLNPRKLEEGEGCHGSIFYIDYYGFPHIKTMGIRKGWITADSFYTHAASLGDGELVEFHGKIYRRAYLAAAGRASYHEFVPKYHANRRIVIESPMIHQSHIIYSDNNTDIRPDPGLETLIIDDVVREKP